MKAAAFIVLTACSPSVVLVPSSLPAVDIDRSLPGHVCSRSAAEVIAALRTRDRGEAEQRQIGCEGRVREAVSGMEQANKRASANAWWGTWGGLMAVAAALVFGGGGMVAGFYIGGSHGR